jgi:hypothetical protein
VRSSCKCNETHSLIWSAEGNAFADREALWGSCRVVTALGKARLSRALGCQGLAGRGGDQIGSSNHVEVKEEQGKDKQLFYKGLKPEMHRS